MKIRGDPFIKFSDKTKKSGFIPDFRLTYLVRPIIRPNHKSDAT